MSILNELRTATHRVVTFPSGLAFMVRPVSSVDLAVNKVAGLMLVAGKRRDDERVRLQAEALEAGKVFAAFQARKTWEADPQGEEPPEVSQGDLLAAVHAITQHKAYQAVQQGPEKAKKAAELNEALVVAGVVKVRRGEEPWMPCKVSQDEESSETEDGVVFNVADLSPFVPGIARAVHQASTEEAAQVVATFPG